MPKELLKIRFIESDVFGPLGQDKNDHLNDAENKIDAGNEQESFYIGIGHAQRHQGSQIGEPDQSDVEIAILDQTNGKNDAI